MEWITLPEIEAFALEIDRDHARQFGPCACCGNMTSRIWGYAYRENQPIAAYFVEWTPGHSDKEATFDLIIGPWGEGTESADRKAISLAFRHTETGPAFMVQNATTRKIASSSLVTQALDREQVIGTPVADTAFAISDLIYLGDPRIKELRSIS